MRFVVLSSSRGTTFQAVLDALKDGSLTAECIGLISDKEERGCTEKARSAGIPVEIVSRDDQTREEIDQKIDTVIRSLAGLSHSDNGDVYIACIGWMFVLTPGFVHTWHRRILNVHPALLPKYPGAYAIDDALAAGDAETGMTIHWIDEGVDTGEIIVQKKCSIESSDTRDELKVKIQKLESAEYPKILQKIQEGSLS